MLTIRPTKENLLEYLGSFIWEYKIGDNIKYNLDIIYLLIEDCNNGKTNYRKPISILCVSVIEAIFVDFLERLNMGTNHFPQKLNNKKSSIKDRLNKEKKEFQRIFLDKVYQYKKLRNFGYQDLIDFLQEFSILGPSVERYDNLQRMGYFRNRVHINNYFGNFERDEPKVFSEKRTQLIIDYMTNIFGYFKDNYSRP